MVRKVYPTLKDNPKVGDYVLWSYSGLRSETYLGIVTVEVSPEWSYQVHCLCGKWFGEMFPVLKRDLKKVHLTKEEVW